MIAGGHNAGNINPMWLLSEEITLQNDMKYLVIMMPENKGFELADMTDDEIVNLMAPEENITVIYSNLDPIHHNISNKIYVYNIDYPSIKLGSKNYKITVMFKDPKVRSICQAKNGPNIEKIEIAEGEPGYRSNYAKAVYKSPEDVKFVCSNVPTLKDLAIAAIKKNPELLEQAPDAYRGAEKDVEDYSQRAGELRKKDRP